MEYNGTIAVITFDAVSVCYRDTFVLQNFSVDLHSNRIAILGANGSGKSTFAKVTCGLLPIHSGTISLYQKNIKSYPNIWQMVNLNFQIPDQQIIMPTVEEELTFGLQHGLHLKKEQIQEKLDYALSILQLPASRACHSLSAGQKRMLCLLSIILLEPKTIILDEATTFLDLPSTKRLMDLLASLEQQIIFITQDLGIAAEFREIMCIHNTRLLYFGPSSEGIACYKEMY